MHHFYALIFDDLAQSWIAYENPVRIIRASAPEQVLSALQDAESAAAAGYTAIGYVSYEAAPGFDRALQTHESDIPPLLFAVFDGGTPRTLDDAELATLSLRPEISEKEHARRMASVHKYLGEGDSYQVNLTFKLRGNMRGDTRNLFAYLLSSQPGTRSVYLEWDDTAVCCLSPELFFQLDGERLAMEPMKGTRPRGIDYDHDQRLGQELLQSDKERAENLMIVDMVRNDLGKIAKPGTVKVDELFRILRLPTLWQQVSTVSCNTDATISEIFQATFPCASITGAPKARSMEIIRELESGPRGIYTGAIGCIRPQGHARFSVAIRTLVVDRRSGQGELGVGGGIVWDSEAAAEWQEALSKSRFLEQPPTPDFQLLETMAYQPGRGILLLDRHLLRLQQAADYFGFPFDRGALEAELTKFHSMQAQRLRLLQFRDGHHELQVNSMPAVHEPVRLVLTRIPVNRDNPFLYFKTSNRAVYDLARQQANIDSDYCDDVILFNEQGEITETTIYNLFLEIDGELLTPALQSGVLAGTYRQMLLDSGKAKAAILKIEDLQRATRILVANSVREFLEANLEQTEQLGTGQLAR